MGGETCDRLGGLLNSFLTSKPYTLTSHIENNGREHVFVASDVGISPECFSMMIGDIAHAARTTLDHLAYSLARKPNIETAFAIWDGPRKDRNGHYLPLTIAGDVPREVKRILKSVQPCSAGKNPLLSRLAQLRDLDNIDKHRIVVAAVASHDGSYQGFIPPVTCAWRLCSTWGALEDRKEVARFIFAESLPDQKIEFDIMPCIGVRDIHPAIDGYNIVGRLIGLIQEVRDTAELFKNYLKR